MHTQQLFDMPHITERMLTELIEVILTDCKLVSRMTFDGILKKRGRKGIVVEACNEGVYVQVRICLYDTVAILPACLAIQKEIKETIEAVAGFTVHAIDIKVEQLIKAYLL